MLLALWILTDLKAIYIYIFALRFSEFPTRFYHLSENLKPRLPLQLQSLARMGSFARVQFQSSLFRDRQNRVPRRRLVSGGSSGSYRMEWRWWSLSSWTCSCWCSPQCCNHWKNNDKEEYKYCRTEGSYIPKTCQIFWIGTVPNIC